MSFPPLFTNLVRLIKRVASHVALLSPVRFFLPKVFEFLPFVYTMQQGQEIEDHCIATIAENTIAGNAMTSKLALSQPT